MKTKITLLLLFSILIRSEFRSQNNLNATLNTFKRLTPLIGFNGAANFCSATWTNQNWLDSVATLNAGILRYPGGTNSNHWDWQTGYWQNAPTTPTYVANLTGTCIARADEFKLGLNACLAKALMVINFQYSNVTYQIQGLNYALSKGVPIERIEMGNEHNISSSIQQYIPATTYATTGKKWADSLKAHFPTAKVCMVGGAISNTSSPTYGWHDSIFSKNPNIDALSFHLYLGAGNTDNKFFTRRALSIPFSSNAGVNYRYNYARFTQTVIPSNIEVWTTEFNLSEQLAGNPIQHAGTWTHGLYISAMSHLLMSQPKITMLIDHNITNTTDFAAVDITHKITASGVAMKLLGEVSKGTDSTALINFNGQANVTWSTTTYPSLIGWKFWKTNVENAWICNLSNQAIKVSVNEVVGNNFSYDHYWADTNYVVNGIKSLNHTNGLSVDSVTLPAYSISVLKNQSLTSIKKNSKETNFVLFPNPANNILYFSKALNDVKIYNTFGQVVLSNGALSNNISVEDLPDGLYFLHADNLVTKFIIKH